MRLMQENNQDGLQGSVWRLYTDLWLAGKPGGDGGQGFAPGGDEKDIEQFLDAVRELRLPAEIQQRIRESVSKAVNKAKEANRQVEAALPILMRLFVQKGRPDNRLQGASGADPATDQGRGEDNLNCYRLRQESHHAGSQPQRGWGYFLIERSATQADGSIPERHCSIDLFLYTEG